MRFDFKIHLNVEDKEEDLYRSEIIGLLEDLYTRIEDYAKSLEGSYRIYKEKNVEVKVT